MDLLNGTYRLVSGNGQCLCVTFKAGIADPYDQGGPILGEIRFSDRTVTIGRDVSEIDVLTRNFEWIQKTE